MGPSPEYVTRIGKGLPGGGIDGLVERKRGVARITRCPETIEQRPDRPVAAAGLASAVDDATAGAKVWPDQPDNPEDLAAQRAQTPSGPDLQGEPRPGVRRESERGLYLNPPDNVMVLSVDEKTSTPARADGAAAADHKDEPGDTGTTTSGAACGLHTQR